MYRKEQIKVKSLMSNERRQLNQAMPRELVHSSSTLSLFISIVNHS